MPFTATQATSLGELSGQERITAVAQQTRLRALVAGDRLAKLQKTVPAEIEHCAETWSSAKMIQ
ncbi:hypothetical protein AXG94_25990 [Pseudomonas corrugata]|nr:hypothetical protein AXG94_25990 [Pseudomonas corrugata]